MSRATRPRGREDARKTRSARFPVSLPRPCLRVRATTLELPAPVCRDGPLGPPAECTRARRIHRGRLAHGDEWPFVLYWDWPAFAQISETYRACSQKATAQAGMNLC